MKKLRITVDGKVYDVTVQVLEDDEATLTGAGYLSPLPPIRQPPRVPPPVEAGTATTPAPGAAVRPSALKDDPTAIRAPIAGTVQKVFVEVGKTVDAKAPVVLLDAMKMDTYIYAPRAMTVTEVAVKPGDAVQVGDRLIRGEPAGLDTP